MHNCHLLRQIPQSSTQTPIPGRLWCFLNDAHSDFIAPRPIPRTCALDHLRGVQIGHECLCVWDPCWFGIIIVVKRKGGDVMEHDVAADETCDVGVVRILGWVEVRAEGHKRV